MTVLRWAFRATILLLVLLGIWIAVDSLTRPVSTLMLARLATGRPVERRWVSLDEISPQLVASVILSEDGQFCRNAGVDWTSLRLVLHGRSAPTRGASTLTMQVAKNLFLWPGHSYLRKAIEIPMALLLDVVWSKRRILEYYFNIAEWGDGIFGAEAAARRNFQVSAEALTARQAALMATALPNPILRKPDRPSRLHRALADRIVTLLPQATSHVACVE